MKKLLPLILALAVVWALFSFLFSDSKPEAPSGKPTAAPIASNSDIRTESGSDLICTAEYVPVCGKNGRTYSNACMAKKDGQETGRSGMCAESAGADLSVGADADLSVGADLRVRPADAVTGTIDEETANGATTVFGSGNSEAGSGLLNYVNDSVGYGFSMPKKAFYSGFGARDGANHSVGIGRAASPESFELSEVKVRFYKGKTLPEAKNATNGLYEDVEKGVSLLFLSGGTVTVEGDRMISADIIDTVVKTAFTE